MPTSGPEKKVKDRCKKCLSSRSEHGMYYNMPVPTGFGTPTLDFIGCYYGQFFAIETKAPGKKPTPRQRLTIEQMREAGGAVFVIDGDTTELEAWLDAVANRHGGPQ